MGVPLLPGVPFRVPFGLQVRRMGVPLLSCKPGAGKFVAAVLALQIKIREAAQCGKVTPEQIPGVYRNRLAEIRETDGWRLGGPTQTGAGQRIWQCHSDGNVVCQSGQTKPRCTV